MKTRDLVVAGLLIALAVTLPLAAHLIKVGGPVLLPMHIPIFLAGLLLGPGLAAAVGVLAPLVSFFLTGMPPLSPPVLPLMVVELATYALVLSVLTRRTSWSIWLTLPVAMLAGRVALGLAAAVIGPLFGFHVNPVFYVYGALVQGLPGLALQLIIIPLVALQLRRSHPAVIAGDMAKP
ncbi:ECF transporter S component [Gelria sp. Kuro-4]|uniref:ECF transporter S component n=1 Tax=Gelria sp. Kuro-4 TaxID=2796927 RepID=UPI001BED4677|nr:ECF transporter S component [Gelria sp. Kuro-4]BCV24353.1 membrane protein [Gelria sp. Kuro-4]